VQQRLIGVDVMRYSPIMAEQVLLDAG